MIFCFCFARVCQRCDFSCHNAIMKMTTCLASRQVKWNPSLAGQRKRFLSYNSRASGLYQRRICILSHTGRGLKNRGRLAGTQISKNAHCASESHLLNPSIASAKEQTMCVRFLKFLASWKGAPI